MTQTEYLYKNCNEPTPAWLMEIGKDSEIPWKQFFESRTVFYPGSGLDPQPVEVFGGGHSAHCFIFVDYLEFNPDEIPFPGYSLVFSRSLSEETFFAMYDNPYSYRRDFDFGRFRFESRYDNHEHFVKFYVFERNASCKNPHAVERFALLYLRADAFPVFNAVYAQGRANLFAAVFEDYCCGCEYECFGNWELLHEMAKKAKIFPKFISTGRERCIWQNYAAVDNVEKFERPRDSRRLYKMDQMAFHIEDDFRKYQKKDFAHDFANWFKIEWRPGGERIKFVNREFARFLPDPSIKIDGNLFHRLCFSAACFFNFLIPQIILELGGLSAYHDYARTTGWPVLEAEALGDMSAATIIEKAGLIPEDSEVKDFCRLLKVVAECYAYDLHIFFGTWLNTFDEAAHGRLRRDKKLGIYTVNNLLRSRTEEFIRGLTHS